jgi:hypothetical protein
MWFVSHKGNNVIDVPGDFKKFTSKQLMKSLLRTQVRAVVEKQRNIFTVAQEIIITVNNAGY